jgi:cell division protein ZapE
MRPLHAPTATIPTLAERYRDLVAGGEIERDPAQQSVVAQLCALEAELSQRHFGRKGAFRLGRRPPRVPRGLYIFGEVGRGKTLLMDLFFAASPLPRKRRAHFHEFMLDVHARVHDWRQRLKRGRVRGDDPIAAVASDLAQEADLLCFDEFSVTDIADAMILARLFTALFNAGIVVVATSNQAPDDLYAGGLNRALFVPFIALLKEHVAGVRLAARTDFRLEKLGRAPVWHVPADAPAAAALEAAWRALTGGAAGDALALTVQGHRLEVPRAARGVARFSFAQICEAPLGPADYLKLAREFHTLMIDAIPVMRGDRRNAAKRFITLIDTLYDRAVKLVASAEAEPADLYAASEGFEAQAFKRTASRLMEMRSPDYLALAPGRRSAQASEEGIVET